LPALRHKSNWIHSGKSQEVAELLRRQSRRFGVRRENRAFQKRVMRPGDGFPEFLAQMLNCDEF
jgi:hypothetical protein